MLKTVAGSKKPAKKPPVRKPPAPRITGSLVRGPNPIAPPKPTKAPRPSPVSHNHPAQKVGRKITSTTSKVAQVMFGGKKISDVNRKPPKTPRSARVAERKTPPATRSLTTGQSPANPKNKPIVTPKPLTGVDLFHVARVAPHLPTPGTPAAHKGSKTTQASNTKGNKGNKGPGKGKGTKTTPLSSGPKPDSLKNGGRGVTGRGGGTTTPSRNRNRGGGGGGTSVGGGGGGGGSTTTAPAAPTPSSTFDPNTGDTTTTTVNDSARKLFLKNHPKFAKMNTAQRAQFKKTHPAAWARWLKMKDPKTTKTVSNPLKTRAQVTVNSEIDPQVAELNRQATEATTQGNEDVGKIKQIFDIAQSETEADRKDTETSYSKSTADTQAIYDKLSNDTKTAYEKAAASTNAENQKLGLDANTTADDKSQRDATFLSELQKTQGANATSTIKNQGLNADTMLRRLNASIGASSAVAQNDRISTMKELTRTLSSQAGILKSTKAGKVQVLLGQLLDKKAATDAEAAQNDALNAIAAEKLGISRDTLTANIANNKAKNKTARLALKIKIQGLELTRKKNETDAQYKARANEIRANNSELQARRDAVAAANAAIANKLKAAAAADKTAKAEQGYAGAVTWLSTQNASSKAKKDIPIVVRAFPPQWKGSSETTRNKTPHAMIVERLNRLRFTSAEKNLFWATYYKAFPNAPKG